MAQAPSLPMLRKQGAYPAQLQRELDEQVPGLQLAQTLVRALALLKAVLFEAGSSQYLVKSFGVSGAVAANTPGKKCNLSAMVLAACFLMCLLAGGSSHVLHTWACFCYRTNAVCEVLCINNAIRMHLPSTPTFLWLLSSVTHLAVSYRSWSHHSKVMLGTNDAWHRGGEPEKVGESVATLLGDLRVPCAWPCVTRLR